MFLCYGALLPLILMLLMSSSALLPAMACGSVESAKNSAVGLKYFPSTMWKIYTFRGGVRGSGAGVGGLQKSIKKTAQWLPGELGPRKLER